MSCVSLYIATSLDGYIARSDGDVDWLEMADDSQEDYGYASFYREVDVLLMGRLTYDQIRKVADWPYTDKKVLVLSSRKLRVIEHDIERVNSLNQLLHEIQKYNNIWLVGGGQLVSALHNEGLIDDYIISVLPIVLGEGILLFQPPLSEQKLRLVKSEKYPSGLVQNHYRKP